jgi:hypothetical protein
MTAWAHRYSEPLLWLACAVLVVALSCVPRCARAEGIEDGVVGTSITVERVPQAASAEQWVAHPDHRHVLPPMPACMIPDLFPPWLRLWFACIGFADVGSFVLLFVTVWQRRKRSP